MASLKAEKPAGAGAQLSGQSKPEPPKVAAAPVGTKILSRAAAVPAKPAAPKKPEPKPTSQPKKKAPTAGKK